MIEQKSQFSFKRQSCELYVGPSARLTLCAQNGRLAPARRPAEALARLLLEHRGVLEHVGQYEEADLGAADVDVLQVGGASVAVGDRDLGHLAVHVVLRLDELAAVHLAGDCLASDYVALGLVQHFDGYSDRHVGCVFM